MAGKLGGVLGIIGAILLIVALFTAFYTISESGSSSGISVSGSTSLYLNDKVVTTASGGGVSYSHTATYSDSHANATGNLYNIVTYLTYGGIVLGFLGAILAFLGRTGAGRGLLVLALILALVGPILLLAEQPAAAKSDAGGSTSGSSPASSFFGSCSGTDCGTGVPVVVSGVSATWGPDIGWYLSIVAFVLFLLGVLLGGAGKPAPAPTPAPAMTPSSPMGAPETAGTPEGTGGGSNTGGSSMSNLDAPASPVVGRLHRVAAG